MNHERVPWHAGTRGRSPALGRAHRDHSVGNKAAFVRIFDLFKKKKKKSKTIFHVRNVLLKFQHRSALFWTPLWVCVDVLLKTK